MGVVLRLSSTGVTKMFLRSALAGALLVSATHGSFLYAQEAPAAPTPAPATSAPQFPPVGPNNFSATTPTRETVEQFLKISWGYDTDRVWEVFAIEPTPAPNVSKVTIYVAQKSNAQQIAPLVFYVTPDGNHLIANEVLPFGAHPYAETRRALQERAAGPSRGASDKKFEFVEFADFQCPHCKAVQPTIERLVQDFPNARFVFENFPLVSIHSEAYKAAAYGVCVAQQGGDAAFFKYADAVFANQQNLTPEGSDAALGEAVTKAGLDPAKIGSCSYTSAGKTPVDASVKLARDLNVNETPMLFINGRQIPVGEVANGELPYEKLKEIVAYQFSLDQ
ncbi:protein-disulfide isomerase [Silvibacterium bohemicum]|uniref:Protein-disulfide isomerase n=1 Tax=Silvibacterium bohemicum TaxID=1577686 RepID=A0A841JU43_9BACT|nr:thioredoxin domain-containing protein [Silvibacterium bohemicum]MBB6144923.1 protein-disulfide isomerase [Silvibacterium bohemicum]